MSVTTYDPLLGFRFRVMIAGLAGTTDSGDMGFMKITGLEANVGIYEWPEISDPVTAYKFPDKFTFGDVVLERGVVTTSASTVLWHWLEDVENLLVLGKSGSIRKTVRITAAPKGRDFNQAAYVSAWDVYAAFPKAIKFGEFNATSSAVVIESLTLANEGIRFLG